MIRALCLNHQEFKRFNDLIVCLPTTCEVKLSFILGGELADTQTTSDESTNVYEGKTKPGVTSQLLKMSLTVDTDQIKADQVRLEFIEEQKKSLLLRHETIENFNSIVEIGFEHYLLGLGSSADSVIVEDWTVRKRI